jgi:uncharacterized damage-inducible protein DinB
MDEQNTLLQAAVSTAQAAADPAGTQTIGDLLPWTRLTLDYTESVCAVIPEAQLNWRPIDPGGRFFFSLAELVMHMSDMRRRFARQLSGKPSVEGYWCTSPTAAADGSWEFRVCGGKAELLGSLEEGRRELEHWLDLPAAQLHDTTPATVSAYEEKRKKCEEPCSPEDEALLKRGPATILRVLMAASVHEAGHRGALQTLLRQLGVHVDDPAE